MKIKHSHFDPNDMSYVVDDVMCHMIVNDVM